MRRNQMQLPEDSSGDTSEVLDMEAAGAEGGSSSVIKSSSEASSCQMYDRLIFLAVPLAVVIKDGSEVPSVTKEDAAAEYESYSAFEGSVKPQLLLETGLQYMVRELTHEHLFLTDDVFDKTIFFAYRYVLYCPLLSGRLAFSTLRFSLKTEELTTPQSTWG
jgi:hypothetical protein